MDDTKKFTCHICGKTFTRKFNKDYHVVSCSKKNIVILLQQENTDFRNQIIRNEQELVELRKQLDKKEKENIGLRPNLEKLDFASTALTQSQKKILKDGDQKSLLTSFLKKEF